MEIGGFQVEAPAFRRVIGQVQGAVKPPGAVVIPEVMVWAGGLLATGNNRGVGVHDDVVVVIAVAGVAIAASASELVV